MSDRKVFTDSVTPLPDEPGLTPRGLMVNAAQPEDQNEVIPVLFSLAMPADKQAELEKMVAEGKVVSPKDLQTRYVADADDTKSLV